MNRSAFAFGRHETFPLRFGWINKGLRALTDDPRIFTREDATIVLGVGKNMVASIRYWLQATRVASRDPQSKNLRPTQLAKIVFGNSGDPFLEDDATIWLLHWLLATNARDATAIYWFFNHFHKSSFTNVEVSTALTDFVKRELSARTSAKTLKSDTQMVLRMYSKTPTNARVNLEDTLDFPLATLDLQDRLDNRTWRTIPMARSDIPIDVFAYAIAEVFEHGNVNQLAIDDLMYSDDHHCAPGSVFRMTEDGLVEKLVALCEAYPEILRLDRTAGIFQLYKIGLFSSVDILKASYSTRDKLAV